MSKLRRDVKDVKGDQKYFSKTADGVHKKNFQNRYVMRGGIRL